MVDWCDAALKRNTEAVSLAAADSLPPREDRRLWVCLVRADYGITLFI